MLLPIQCAGADTAIPRNFAIDLPDDTPWVADAIDEVLSIAPRLFSTCAEAQCRTSRIHGSLPVRLVANNVIAVGQDAIRKYRKSSGRDPSLKASTPAP